MSFALYRIENHIDTYSYTRIQSLCFTGKEGILARFLQANRGEDTPFAWNLSGPALITAVAPDVDPEAHEVILDMLPEGLVEACLYRVHGIQGSSDEDHTDLALNCQPLYQGRIRVAATEFKAAFHLPISNDRRQMLEALGLTGGLRSGNYFWTRPKMNLGAAIYSAPAPVAPVQTHSLQPAFAC